ncbi:MAG: glycosyltransferase family 39 protein [Kiritimatiellia bacterium]|jgi:4-amino-4-deoxy-L-arabinose transferase-like glycosyltransferase
MDTNSPWSRSATRSVALMLLLTLLVMLFCRGLIESDEGRYAEIPREMAASGNWMEIRLLGFRYYEKPPLTYWLTAPAIVACGARDWAVRIPLALNLLGIAWLFYRLMRREWSAAYSRIVFLVAATSLGFIIGLTLLMTDPFLTLFFSLTCYWAYLWFEAPPTAVGKRTALAVGVGIAAALGFLTKGAVAVVLPGAIILIWTAWERRLRNLRLSLLVLSGVIFLTIAGSALFLIEQHNPGFCRQFIWDEHIARFQGTCALQGHEEPFWFFAYIIPLLMTPWTLFAVRAVRTAIKRHALSTDRLTRLLLVWAVVVVLFFSISTGKLMSYVLPAMVPIMILLGRWGVAEPFDGTATDRRLIRLGIAGVLFVAAALILVLAVGHTGLLSDQLQKPNAISLLALLPVVVCTWQALRRLHVGDDFRAPMAICNAGILLTAALMLTPLAGHAFNAQAYKNSSIVYKTLATKLEPEDRIISLWSYRPSLAFYTGRIYRPYQNQNELLFGINMEPDRPADIQHPDEIRAMAAEKKGRIYVLIEPEEYITRFQDLGLKYRKTDLPSDPRTIVLEILPE